MDRIENEKIVEHENEIKKSKFFVKSIKKPFFWIKSLFFGPNLEKKKEKIEKKSEI